MYVTRELGNLAHPQGFGQLGFSFGEEEPAAGADEPESGVDDPAEGGVTLPVFGRVSKGAGLVIWLGSIALLVILWKVVMPKVAALATSQEF